MSRLILPGPFLSAPHPFMYYLAIGIIILGLFLIGIGILGCWASCLESYFLLSVYALVIILLLIGECAIYTATWVWPNCLGLNLNADELTKTLQKNYGVASQEQITASIDLAQTIFHCCGINNANEYDMSLWRLQELGPEKLAIPLTCCVLDNIDEMRRYLNPQPLNSTLCQALEPTRHEGFRYKQGCFESMDRWYKEQYIVFLTAGLVVVLVEFAVLLSTIVAFTTVCNSKHTVNEHNNRDLPMEQRRQIPKVSENIYQENVPYPYSNDSFTIVDSFHQNHKFIDRI